MKTVVIETDDFTAYYDQHQEHTFLHCDVYRYNSSVKSDLQTGLKVLSALRQTPLFALHEIHDSKHLKFITMLGFKYLETRLCLDGCTRDIYITQEN
jgi:hypothetical protein